MKTKTFYLVGGGFLQYGEFDFQEINRFLYENPFSKVDINIGVNRGIANSITLTGYDEKPFSNELHELILIEKRNRSNVNFRGELNIDDETNRFTKHFPHSRIVKQRIINSNGIPTQLFLLVVSKK